MRYGGGSVMVISLQNYRAHTLSTPAFIVYICDVLV